MGNVAASGGYWIAMGADEVWASPSTITGSIGVFGFLPTFAGTLEKMGLDLETIGRQRRQMHQGDLENRFGRRNDSPVFDSAGK